MGGAAQVAIEAFRPAGPRFFFGMLGGSFKPDANLGGLRVVVECSTDDAPPVSDTLANSLDNVHSGIPEWVTDTILNLASEAAERHECLRGTISLSYGAFGDVGSSTVVFAYLARVLFALLERASQPLPLGQEEIALIVADYRL